MRENVYSGIAAALAVGRAAAESDEDFRGAFAEAIVDSDEIPWSAKSLPGLSQKMLWRNAGTGASIALLHFDAGAGIPSIHTHASNQFMFCLSGRYSYPGSGITLTKGSFYWNPLGREHGPTVAEEDSVLLEVFDGPHYPAVPDWYSRPEDAR